MKFKRLAEFFQKIEKTPSRLEITRHLAGIFREVEAEEIDQLVYLSLGVLKPKFAGIDFALGEKMILRVIAVAEKTTLKIVEDEYKKTGNLASLIHAKKKLIKRNLSVPEVYKKLYEIAVDEGLGSQDRKVRQMAQLLQDLDWLSAQYAVRIPVNNLRLGFSEMTVLDGLSWMEKGDKSLRPDLERAFNVAADIGLIAKTFKQSGLKGISKIQVTAGVPVRPAKSERLPSADKIVEKLLVFGVEGKWDGLRVQIHMDRAAAKAPAGKVTLFEEEPKEFVRIFSRNLDNVTNMFPDIIAAAEQLPVESVILDGEAVAYDPKTGKLLAFQETVQRKRKHGVDQKALEMPMKVFVYDILLLNGINLMEKTFRERRKVLEKIFVNSTPGVETSFTPGVSDGPVKEVHEIFTPEVKEVHTSGVNRGQVLNLAEQEIVSDVTQLRELMTKYLALGLEGVMCKKLTTSYQAGARNFNWVKLKKATEGELTDTIDCVVMGYYLGKGKRTNFGVGAFLVGVSDGEKIASIAKIGTGLTDEQWKELAIRCQSLEIDKEPEEYLVDKNLAPDVWVRPELVTEILADEITKSPIHGFGLALRFPRLVNFRDDKNLSEATNRQELEKLYKMQKK